MTARGFEGWYFKHQSPQQTLALIPGRAKSGAFVQVMDENGSHCFAVSHLRVENGIIYAGKCRFSKSGCHIALPNLWGELHYGPLTPLQRDIMGPFRFFPMQCRHGIISMSHSITGQLVCDGVPLRFDGGRGYIETDCGTSFPRSYIWLQCNDFPEPCAVVVSVAHIPFGPLSFTGCICAIVWQGREFRLATYGGVKLCSCTPEEICLQQGSLRFSAQISALDSGHPLAAPVKGQMSRTIRESHQAAVRCRLWQQGQLLFDLKSRRASFEYVPRAL